MNFATPLAISGPLRSPVQMLEDQRQGDDNSIHDAATAARLGLIGAPIEGCTHFSQVEPLAAAVWGTKWFTHGCISSHFRNMVIEGEQVAATLTTTGPTSGRIDMAKADGTPVLAGTASVGLDDSEPELARRLRELGDPGELFILDQLQVGMTFDGMTSSVDFEGDNGRLYPFTLAAKLEVITEPHPWFTAEGGPTSPWGRPILPMEMVSVLVHKGAGRPPVRMPSQGLFLDLQIRLVDGPVFVGQDYAVRREVVGLGQSRRTESYWLRSTLTDTASGKVAAETLLHAGVFKQSYSGYPASRLA